MARCRADAEVDRQPWSAEEGNRTDPQAPVRDERPRRRERRRQRSGGIVGPSGAAVGALSITSPAVRADAAMLKQRSGDACAAAARISAALGGRLAAA